MKEDIIGYLRLVHGTYNFIVFLLFMYQASLGYRIRKERIGMAGSGAPVILRHRRLGPVIAALGIGGYVAGTILVLIDKGHIFYYPLHFISGMLIVILIMSAVLVSRQIRHGVDRFRKIHYRIGLCIIFLYVLQISIGTGIVAGVVGTK